jgi:hypothetical protein
MPITSLRIFSLEFYNESPDNNSFNPPSTLPLTSPTKDLLSIALHKLSQAPNLTSITLRGPIAISPSFFWSENLASAPLWPNLQTMQVTFNNVAPNGDWYFIRDPYAPAELGNDEDEDVDDSTSSESTSDDDSELSDSSIPDSYNSEREARRSGDKPIRRYRTFPSNKIITPLLVSVAKAAAHMPKLQRLDLTTDLPRGNADIDAAFEMTLVTPRFRYCRHANLRVNEIDDLYRLDWLVRKWRPESEVLDAWKNFRHDLIVKYTEP